MPIVNGGDETAFILAAEAYLNEHSKSANATRVKSIIKNLRAGKKVEDLDLADRPVIREIIAWAKSRSDSLMNHVLAKILDRIKAA
jgi:hypothetical protein